MLGITKKTTNNGIEVFQAIDSMISGGFTLDTVNLSAALVAVGGAVIPAGSMVAFNEATRLARVVKSASLQSACLAGDTLLKFNKNHLFQPGEVVAAAVGGKAVIINSIDTTTSLAFDIVGLTVAIGAAIPAFGVVFAALAAGNNAAFAQVPNGITDKGYLAQLGRDLSVVAEGKVYARRTPGVPAEARALMPRITFSDSK